MGQNNNYLEGYRDGYSRGYADGRVTALQHADQLVLKYVLPAQREFYRLNSIAFCMAGVVNAGFGELPRQLLKKLNADLGAQMAKVVVEYANARSKGLEMHASLENAQRIFETVVRFIENSGDNGDELRVLFTAFNPEFSDSFSVRSQLQPGAKREGVKSQLDAEALALTNGGKTIEDTLSILVMTPEYAAVIDKWIDPTETLKKRIQRQNKKRQIQGT